MLRTSYSVLSASIHSLGKSLHVCILSYTHTHTHTHTRTQSPHTHTQSHTHTHTHTHACVHTHTHTCVRAHTHTHTHACVHTHTHSHTCVHAHTQSHTHTHTVTNQVTPCTPSGAQCGKRKPETEFWADPRYSLPTNIFPCGSSVRERSVSDGGSCLLPSSCTT